MATTITSKLNKSAREFQAGAYTGFGFQLGKQYYDRETKQKDWTNYDCAIFTNNTQQIEFYRSNLVEGSIVEVTAEAEKIKQYQGNNGLVLTIELIDCKLGFVHSGQQVPQQAPQYAPNQGVPQQSPRQMAQNPHAQPQYAQQAPQQAPQQNGYAQAQQQPQNQMPNNGSAF